MLECLRSADTAAILARAQVSRVHYMDGRERGDHMGQFERANARREVLLRELREVSHEGPLSPAQIAYFLGCSNDKNFKKDLYALVEAGKVKTSEGWSKKLGHNVVKYEAVV